ncbi:uncharacterized protein ANIA_11264 [Aspergillus nidulans FGSC A4]|uniref:Uncharacterized protein n=1 Tax=Emericella nidulans (strain FGSC A4 / ATCC 38163 / CBS 112.46 / NRRL 194 / M139) TaxID=227321 RepID=C8VUN5_EMENI|nr:hypothetical protein [Aspergillus nidulans FGSC A4]CBF89937.1 TPA: hypothetical protein ANIA_11264 [Aspergillus nidulans FGSC A4]
MIHLLPLLRFRLAQLIDPGDCELPSNDRTRQKILLEEMDEDSVTRAIDPEYCSPKHPQLIRGQ